MAAAEAGPGALLSFGVLGDRLRRSSSQYSDVIFPRLPGHAGLACGSACNKGSGVVGWMRPARLFVENLIDVRRHSGLAFRNFTYGNDGNWYSPVERSRQGGIELEWRL